MANYVRFQRGTLAAYQLLVEKGQVDQNTLYFIYGEEDSSAGSLFMGNKIISGGETNYIFSTLDELSDVNVTNAASNSFLVKDSATNNWVAKTPEQVAELIQNYISTESTVNLNGDNLSVEIIDNIIQLKNYGTEYYAFVPANKDESGNIIEESKYVLTEGFKAGLEPKVEELNGELVISWYEPNTEVIDNINENITIIENNVSEIQTDISTIQETLNADDGLITQVENLKEEIGVPSTDSTEASGLYKELENLEDVVNTKANTADVYNKTEVDKAISAAVAGADHLQRKIVANKESIDLTAEDAHLFIYMVPTGLQYEDDKYDEYVVINGILEKVGSWEVDLTNYVTADDLKEVSDQVAEKVDKTYYTVPVLDAEGNPTYDDEGNAITQVVEGTLLSPADKEKIDALSVGNNGVEIDASNVKNLNNWIINNVSGLTENNLSNTLLEKVNYITSVNEANFSVVEGQLNLNTININQITNLQNILDKKVDAEEGSRLIKSNEITLLNDLAEGKYNNFITAVDEAVFKVENGTLNLLAVPADALTDILGDLSTLPNTEKQYKLVDEINNIYQMLTWTDLAE